MFAPSGCDYGFGTSQAAGIVDFVPVAGDIKGIVDAIDNPTAVNVVSATVGLVPVVGDIAAKSIKTGSNILQNAAIGARRQDAGIQQIRSQNPDKVVQRETYLRTAEGKRAVDPVTGEMRRVDAAAIDRASATAKTYEVTGPNVDKTAQAAKEQRILDSGGNYVKDRATGELCKIGGPCQRVNVP